MTVKKTILTFKKGTSDKVYIVEKIQDGKSFKVVAQYGRRNGSLKKIVKCNTRYSGTADNTFDEVVSEKMAKGYVISKEHYSLKEHTKKEITIEKMIEDLKEYWGSSYVEQPISELKQEWNDLIGKVKK